MKKLYIELTDGGDILYFPLTLIVCTSIWCALNIIVGLINQI